MYVELINKLDNLFTEIAKLPIFDNAPYTVQRIANLRAQTFCALNKLYCRTIFFVTLNWICFAAVTLGFGHF